MKKNIIAYIIPIYIILTNLLQILMIESKGSGFDTLFKAIVLIMLIIFTLVYTLKNNIKINRNDLLLFICVLLIDILIFISNIWRTGLTLTYIIAGLYPLINIFIFIVLFGKAIYNDRNLKNFFLFFIIYVVYMCIFNFILNFDDLLSFTKIMRAYEIDFSSFYNNRNTFAFYLIFGIISNLIYIIKFKNKSIFFKLTLLFMFINALLTLSRTALACMFVFIFFNLFTTFNKKNKMIFLFIILLIITFCVNNSNIINFINNNIIRSSSGLTGRNDIWEYGKNLLNNNYILGLGFTYPIESLSKSIFSTTSFHNTYLTIILYGGVVLLLLFILIYFYCLKNIIKLKKYNESDYKMLLSIFIIYLLYGIAETQILFFSSAVSFVSTCFVCLLPKYIVNNYEKDVM